MNYTAKYYFTEKIYGLCREEIDSSEPLSMDYDTVISIVDRLKKYLINNKVNYFAHKDKEMPKKVK